MDPQHHVTPTSSSFVKFRQVSSRDAIQPTVLFWDSESLTRYHHDIHSSLTLPTRCGRAGPIKIHCANSTHTVTTTQESPRKCHAEPSLMLQALRPTAHLCQQHPAPTRHCSHSPAAATSCSLGTCFDAPRRYSLLLLSP